MDDMIDEDLREEVGQYLKSIGMVMQADKMTATHLAGFEFDVDVVFDVGVASGTPFLYQAFPEAEFVLVDPRPESEADARAAGVPARTKFYATAAGAERGEADLIIPETRRGVDADMASLYRRTDGMARNITGETRRRVSLTPLDAIAAKHPGSAGLKIDTEGAEVPVLRGATDLLKRCRFVILELSVTRRFDGVAPPSEAIALLAAAGLELRDVLNTSGDGRGGTRPRHFEFLFARWEDTQ